MLFVLILSHRAASYGAIMAALPYMQLYIADYLADTMHLSAEEHGAYLLLMFNYWQTGKPIPKNRLAKIARLTNERWADVEPSLREFFCDNGDEWVHLRIERDLKNIVTAPRGKKLPEGENLSEYRGYVYFVTSTEMDTVKIGYSKNPWARLGELRRSYGSNLSVVATIKTVEKSESSIHALLSDYRVNGEWFVKSECIKSLITQIVEGKITTVEATNNYVSNYEVVTTVVTTTTTNTDTDLKELNPTHNARVRERAPTRESNGTPSQTTEPEYLDGMSEPIGKFPMTDGWHPSPDFRRRAALWGVALPEPEFTPAEFAAFRDYWAAEGKVFTQIQWEQKFARHVNHVRAQVKPVSKGVNHAAAPGGTASRAVQEIRAAREQWERENGFISDGNGLEAVGTHGGGLFEPLDPEERGRTFEALDCTDWRDD
ncbi:replication protein [Escherichia coli]|nr:replication protein [Escherichia coli]